MSRPVALICENARERSWNREALPMDISPSCFMSGSTFSSATQNPSIVEVALARSDDVNGVSAAIFWISRKSVLPFSADPRSVSNCCLRSWSFPACITAQVPSATMAVNATHAAFPIVANHSEFFLRASQSVSTFLVDFQRSSSHFVTLSSCFRASAVHFTRVSSTNCVSAAIISFYKISK